MVRSKLFRFFPMPRYIVMPSFGLEISERTVKYVEMTETENGLSVGTYGLEHIPVGAVSGGIVVDQSKLVPILATIRKTKKVEAVRISIPEEKVYTFQSEIEHIPGVELRESILLSLEGHIPVPAETVEFDYDIISQNGNKILVQVAAAESRVVESYVSACVSAGMQVIACEYECQALARAVTKPKEKSVIYLVDIGRLSTTLAVVQDGLVVSSSTIVHGGEEATAAIAKEFKLERMPAEALKHKVGLTQNPEYPTVTGLLSAAYAPLFQEIINQYNAWLTYIRERSDTYRQIDSIQLVGTEALIPGFPDLFQASLHKPVALANVWARVEAISKEVPKIHFSDSVVYGTAVGLALGAFET